MTTSATPSEDAQHWARALYELKIAMLGELAEGGMALARAVKDQVLGSEVGIEPVVLEGLIRAYGRAARTVRLTLMLQDRLIKTLLDFDKVDAPDTGRDEPKRIEIVRIIVDPQEEREKRERLAREGAERLDRETFEEAVLDRSVNEFVATIRQDAGLDPHQPLEGEAREKEEAASGTARSPSATLTPTSSGRPTLRRTADRPPRPYPDG
jgi:hypothetical protein